MTFPRTLTYTWTRTRLETIQDQFKYLLLYGDVAEDRINKIVEAIGQKAIQAVGIYGCDALNLRIAEVELKVDWVQSAQLAIGIPTIAANLPGWRDGRAPEVRVTGQRFAQLARELGLSTAHWVRFTEDVRRNEASHRDWCNYLDLSFRGSLPQWKTSPSDRSTTLLDLGEVNIFLRRI